NHIYLLHPLPPTPTLIPYTTLFRSNPDVFSIENIREGEYLMIALMDNNNNYTFEPKVDKIGFVDGFISVPSETSFHINLFKEIRSEEHTSELQSRENLVCRLLLEKK